MHYIRQFCTKLPYSISGNQTKAKHVVSKHQTQIMTINWNNHIDRLRSQIADLRSTLRVIKTKAHDERPGLEQTTAQLRELVDKDESQKTLYQFPKILHKILHNPAVGAIILGPNGEHLLFNTAAERLLGSDLMADALAEKSGNFGFYQTDKVTKYTKEQLPWQQAVLGEQVPEVDLFVRRQGYADGLWIKATSTALKSDTNDIGGAVVFLVDITEQVQVENQIQSTCDALEQQISQIGSAQLELQLLTEKLGKLDYLPEATPETVSPKVFAQTSSKSGKSEPKPAMSSAAASADASAVIDYASDELAKWSDLEPSGDAASRTETSSPSSDATGAQSTPGQIEETVQPDAQAPDSESETEPAGNNTSPDTSLISTQDLDNVATTSQEQQDFAAAESDVAPLSKAEPDSAAQTLEEKAKLVNESIVQQLTSEIFAIANQIEPGADGQQEFFAPDSNERQSITHVSPVQPAATEVTLEGKTSTGSQTTPAHDSEKHHKSSKKSTQKQTESEISTAKRRKILIVDDIPVNQKLLRLQLKRLGFECEAANNGDAAQKAVTTGDFALVLMDLDMPIMDGFESTAAIRKNEQGLGKHIPIVAMTSYDRQEDRERCLAAGMDDFLSKGATQKQLHEVVERCMRAASTEQPKPLIASAEPFKETGLDIESLQKQFDKEEVQDVSRLFLSAVNTFIDCIQLGIEEKDAGAVTHFAHSVKGPCAALGIDEMTRLTSEIMSDAEAGNWTQVRVKYMKLKSSFGEVRDQLRELCTPGYV